MITVQNFSMRTFNQASAMTKGAIFGLALFSLVACSASEAPKVNQSDVAKITLSPDANFKSQANPKPTAITLGSNASPHHYTQSHAATFADRAIAFDLSRSSEQPFVTAASNLMIDSKPAGGTEAARYMAALLSNLTEVSVGAITCDDWVETGCNLTVALRGENVRTKEPVECDLVIDMQGRATDSCGL